MLQRRHPWILAALLSAATISLLFGSAQAQEVPKPVDLISLKKELFEAYRVACGPVSPGDEGGIKQTQARTELAAHAAKLADVRYAQLDAGRKLTTQLMDPDEKQRWLARLLHQLLELEALKNVANSDGPCPSAETLLELAPSNAQRAGTPVSAPPPATTGQPAARPGAPSSEPANNSSANASGRRVTDGNSSAKGEAEKKAEEADVSQQGNPEEQEPEGEKRGNQNTIKVSPSELVFARQPFATASDPQTITLTNTSGGVLPVQLPVPLSPNFRITENSCGNLLEKDASCQVKIAFVPFRSRVKSSYVALATGASSTQKAEDFAALADQLKLAEEEVAAARQSMLFAEADYMKTKAEAGKSFYDQQVKRLENGQKGLRKARTAFSNAGIPLVRVTGEPEHWKYPMTRAVVGLDISAASSRQVQQKYFIEFNLLAPITFRRRTKNEDPMENRFWMWLNPRITSLPSATDFSALSTITQSGGFFQPLKENETVKKLAQGLDVSGGIDIAILKPRDGIPFWGEFPNTRARVGVSFIAGLGISTVFSTDKTDIPSQVNQGICDAYQGFFFPGRPTDPNDPNFLAACTVPSGQNRPVLQVSANDMRPNIVFVTPDRSRFFRRYFAGLRFKTYYFNPDVKADCFPDPKRPLVRGDCEAPYNVFPGTVDVTLGQDESVSAGKLRGTVLRLEGSYPLPFYQGVHVFGTVAIRLGRERPTPPFNSYQIETPASFNDTDTFRFPVPLLDRDYFRVGIGVDLIQVFKRVGDGGQPNKDQPVGPEEDPGPSTKTQEGGNPPKQMPDKKP